MSVVQIPRWADRLRRSGGMIGPAGSELLEGTQAIIQVDDLTQSPYKWLSRDFLLTGSFDIAAAAGQFPTSTISFGNTDLYTCWVRRLVISSSIVQAVQLGWDTGLTGVNQNVVSRDQRADRGITFLQGMVTASQSSQAALFAAADRIANFGIQANNVVQLALDLLIDGSGVGRGLTVQGQTAASGLFGWWEFEIFQREPTER